MFLKCYDARVTPHRTGENHVQLQQIKRQSPAQLAQAENWRKLLGQRQILMRTHVQTNSSFVSEL